MNIAVTGGAGYIGSHFTRTILDEGHHAFVIDNLSTGYLDAVDVRATFYQCDLHDTEQLKLILRENNIDAVVHFAAFSLVGESVTNPLKYYRNNVEGTRSLLDAMNQTGVKYIVFSSTAAVYGMQEAQPILETTLAKPINPYGKTKLAMEGMIDDLAGCSDLTYVSLRYFNVAGAHPSGTLGERHNPETHLTPIILQAALGLRSHISVFGTDYPTKDGSCIRDYIHVLDLCDAHLLALNYLANGNSSTIVNLGTTTGTSVLEMIEQTKLVTGNEIPLQLEGRRDGDPAVLIASNQKAKELLGWTPNRTKDIIADAWKFMRNWHA